MTISSAHEPAPLEPGKRDKALRQQALIEAATAVFAEHGYDAATTHEVAQRAGCSEGLIHRYFGGKRGLLLAIIESQCVEIVERLGSSLPQADSPEEEIEQLLLWHLAGMWERRDLMRVSVSEAIIDPQVGRSVNESINRRRVDLIIERLRPHQEAGRLRDDVDLEVIAQAVAGLGFALGFMGQVVFGMDRNYVKRLSAGTARLLSRGITKQPPMTSTSACPSWEGSSQ
jgi:AcrR family transcriptional regulator